MASTRPPLRGEWVAHWSRHWLVLALLLGTSLAGCFGDGTSDWAYRMTGVRSLQATGLDGTDVVVAIIDTGIDADHEALDHLPIRAWRDYVNGRPRPYDDQGHGTHVASIVGASGGSFESKVNGFDLKGAAPGISLIIVKAISAESKGETQDVVDGIDFAIANNADIICLSLGSRSSPLRLVTDDMQNAVNRALNGGILVVASAGNTGADASDVESPASVQGVIAVAAVDERQRVAPFSSKGDNDGVLLPGLAPRTDPHRKPEVAAPGVSIKGAWLDGGYALASGTSQAAPFVCGGLALLLDAEPSLRADNSRSFVNRVKNALMDTAEPVPRQAEPHDDRAGYGLFRADRLVAELAP